MEVLNVTDTIYIYTYIEDKTDERVLLKYTAASMRLQSQHTFQLRRKPKTMV